MKPIVGRFVLLAALFLGWIGYLGYLVLTARDPVVLSQPQFMVADVTVIAEIKQSPEQSNTIVIKEVRGPQHGASVELWKTFPKVGDELTLDNLDKTQGYSTPGEYIVPLVFTDKSRENYRVAPVPQPLAYGEGQSPNWPKFWIYPVKSDTLSQMEELVTQKK